MKLYGSYTSPFVRKCRITAIEAGLCDRIEFEMIVIMDDTADQPNPLKMVPSLMTEDHGLIVDSRVICDFLSETGSRLEGTGSWADRTLVAMADGMTDRAVSLTLESRRDASERSPGWQTRWTSAIHAILPELERRVPDAFSPGAVALYCGLAYLDFRFPHLEWRSGHQRLSDWHNAHADRASIVETEHPS